MLIWFGIFSEGRYSPWIMQSIAFAPTYLESEVWTKKDCTNLRTTKMKGLFRWGEFFLIRYLFLFWHALTLFLHIPQNAPAYHHQQVYISVFCSLARATRTFCEPSTCDSTWHTLNSCQPVYLVSKQQQQCLTLLVLKIRSLWPKKWDLIEFCLLKI